MYICWALHESDRGPSSSDLQFCPAAILSFELISSNNFLPCLSYTASISLSSSLSNLLWQARSARFILAISHLHLILLLFVLSFSAFLLFISLCRNLRPLLSITQRMGPRYILSHPSCHIPLSPILIPLSSALHFWCQQSLYSGMRARWCFGLVGERVLQIETGGKGVFTGVENDKESLCNAVFSVLNFLFTFLD